MIQLYNTRTHTIEPLHIENNHVTLYVCGVTPYDTTHLGHAFTYIMFDVLIRLLRYQKNDVTYVQNVTDIDDPLFEKARELKTDWKTLGDTWVQRFQEDMKELNILSPNHYPRVTEVIPEIIQRVQILVEKQYGYEKEGYVYFDISKFKEYGALSRLTHEEMIPISAQRGNNPDDPRKRNPLDFVLWQPSKADEPSWESPWGKGRPGWHIECTAMSTKYLGEQMTLHGGGSDLIFPHHESEIAQSESSTGKKPFAYHFMHTAMVSHAGEKMSKSLGNLILVRDLLRQYSADAIRWYLMTHHYQTEWEYDEKDLILAQQKTIVLAKSFNKAKSQAPSSKVDLINTIEDNLDIPKTLELLYDRATDGKLSTKDKEISKKVLGFTWEL